MTIIDTINYMIEKETDEKKLGCLSELGMFCVESKADEKINGRKLFELVEKLVKEWPEFVTMLVATSYLASAGLSNVNIDPKEIVNIDLSDYMTEE